MIKRTRMFVIIVVISFVLGAVFTKYLMPKYFDIESEIKKEDLDDYVEKNSMEDENQDVNIENKNDTIKENEFKIAFKSTLETYEKGRQTMYAVADIDKDGVPELIVRTGEFEAEYMFYFYKYTGIKSELIGNIGAGHSVLYEMDDENYLLCVYAHMGYESVAKVFIEDNKIKYEQISQRENLPNEDYSKGDKVIELYDLNDDSAIEEYK